jgi:hypothetical protein
LENQSRINALSALGATLSALREYYFSEAEIISIGAA